ncbi:PaaX family transcriptional regulator [Thalassospira marina]|uniref:Phenylacetic acid degradation operon negative regulatory protein PaaX n=1 Tax=Thalassospira marina TaxID=2048283 RepID=A0A2N3KEK1_9PROT|nr:PaaX family transcriptional regulator C-terminal domain-containing protein [Thalassospira marina]PKR48916.1 hypothetical protein COO20_23420 [Thalassospira marina]
MNRKLNPAYQQFEQIRSALDLSSRAVVITFLCDVLRPRGDSVFLADLIALLSQVGVSERVLRTAVFRMSRDGWLETQRVGRQALYQVTAEGWRLIDPGCRQFYTAHVDKWDGQWTLIIFDNHAITADQRRTVARLLGWRGFGAVSANVFAHPGIDIPLTRQILTETGLAQTAISLRAETQDIAESASLRDMVAATWDLAALQRQYQQKLALFEPLLSLDLAALCSPELAFALRMLLMHGFKQVVLRDPGLPAELLPANWAGIHARAVIRRLYWQLVPLSEPFVNRVFNQNDPAIPGYNPPASWFFKRLGGADIAPVA